MIKKNTLQYKSGRLAGNSNSFSWDCGQLIKNGYVTINAICDNSNRSATYTLQYSNDNTNWITLTSESGTPNIAYIGKIKNARYFKGTYSSSGVNGGYFYVGIWY